MYYIFYPVQTQSLIRDVEGERSYLGYNLYLPTYKIDKMKIFCFMRFKLLFHYFVYLGVLFKKCFRTNFEDILKYS